MAIVCIVLAIGLGFVAWHAVDEGTGVRVFFLAAALLNAGIAGHMIATKFDHTWRLMPAESQITVDPLYRR